MSNIDIQFNQTNGVVLRNPVFADASLVSVLTPETYTAGTILGRITATGELTAYASAAVDGSEIPLAVLTYDVDLLAATPVPIRALISGEVRRERVEEFGVPTPITDAVADQLRSFTILPLDVQQLTEQDNS